MYTYYAKGKKTRRKLCVIFQKRIFNLFGNKNQCMVAIQKLSTYQRGYRETDPFRYPLLLDNINVLPFKDMEETLLPVSMKVTCLQNKPKI